MKRLFDPKSVAVIGASADSSKIGNVVLKSLMAGPREVYPVNPHEERILGARCFPSIADIPSDIDLALIVLPADASVRCVRECVDKGVRFVIVASSGYRESGALGARLEEEIVEAVKGSGTRLLGPNTMGLFVPSTHLDTLFVTPERSRRPEAGSVALISQSGAVAVSFLEKAESAGMGLSACVCLGNMCDIDELELIDHFAMDEGTRCIALYLESFSDGRALMEHLEAAAHKPLVMLKSGRTSAGRRAAMSHTGAMASSSDAVVSGALKQACAVRVFDEEELVDVSMAFAALDHLRGGSVCVVASAGGFGVIASDLVESEEYGEVLDMAELSEATRERLRGVMPRFTSPANPVDLTAGVTDEMYDLALEALQDDASIDVILMSLELQPPSVSKGLMDVAARRASSGGPPIVVSAFAKDQGDVIREMAKLGVVSYPTIRRSVRSISALVRRGLYLKRHR